VKEHEKYISRCIELAGKALGHTAPNPLVGCVIVHEGKIIGEGYHKEYGGPHAEVNAIDSVENKEKLKDSTLFVNLEPCSHFGKTPPCSDLIIKMGIPKVVIGNVDPFEKIAGKGIQKLENAKIQIVSGIMEKECAELNKRFLTFHLKKRPYIILKWAQTTDGFISPENKTSGKQVWITDEKLKILVHKMRTEEQAIMVGTNTALTDNPQLNVRLWKGKDPLRIVLDRNLRLPYTLHLFDKSIPTIILTSKDVEKLNDSNLEYIRIDFSKNIIKQICDLLFARKIQSLFVEGGTMLHQTFIDDGTWDEAIIFTGNKEFHEGVRAPKIRGKVIKETFFDKDKLVILKNE